MFILGAADLGYKLDSAAALDLVRRFWALGGRDFDTAHVYACWIPGDQGSSERALGAALRELVADGSRVTTKGGHPDLGAMYPRPERYLAPELIEQDLRASLDRLGLDRVDTFLLHRDDPREPVEAVAATLLALRDAGLTRAVGVSNWPRARVEVLRACLDGDLVWQNQGSLAVPNWTETGDPTVRRFTTDDFVWAAEHDVICSCYSAAANGYFARGGEVPGFDNPTSRVRLARVVELAAAKGATAQQVALAWLLAQPGDVRPILGTTKPEHLAEAMGARSLNLTTAERDGLAVVAP